MTPLERQNNTRKYNFPTLVQNLEVQVTIFLDQLNVCFVNPNLEHLFCRQYKLSVEEVANLNTSEKVRTHILNLPDLQDFATTAQNVFNSMTEEDLM